MDSWTMLKRKREEHDDVEFGNIRQLSAPDYLRYSGLHLHVTALHVLPK